VRYEFVFLLTLGAAVCLTDMWRISRLGVQPAHNRVDIDALTERVAEIETERQVQQDARVRIADAITATRNAVTQTVMNGHAGTDIWDWPCPPEIRDACAADSSAGPQYVELPELGWWGNIYPGGDPDAVWKGIRQSIQTAREVADDPEADHSRRTRRR
jgi:hypothetical protein